MAGRKVRLSAAVCALTLYAFMTTEDAWGLGEMLLIVTMPAIIEGYSRWKIAELETNTAVLMHEGKEE